MWTEQTDTERFMVKRAIVLHRDLDVFTTKPIPPRALLLRGFPKDIVVVKAAINAEL